MPVSTLSSLNIHRTLCYVWVGLSVLMGSACTINVYHVEPEELAIDSRLAVPEKPCSTVCNQDEARIVPTGGNTGFSVLEMNADRVPGDSSYQVGDSVVLRVRPSVDAYIHCYYQMANNDIVKIFPNQQNAKSWLYSGQLMAIPERATFKIVPDTSQTSEAFLCLAAAEDLSVRLPESFRESLLKPLPVFSFDEIYRIYRENTAGNLAGRVVTVDIL